MKKQIFISLTCLILISGLIACSGNQSQQVTISPENLGVIGAKIYAAPDQTNEILQDHGITEQQFNSELDRVTTDPDLAARYRTSFEANLETG